MGAFFVNTYFFYKHKKSRIFNEEHSGKNFKVGLVLKIRNYILNLIAHSIEHYKYLIAQY